MPTEEGSIQKLGWCKIHPIGIELTIHKKQWMEKTTSVIQGMSQLQISEKKPTDQGEQTKLRWY